MCSCSVPGSAALVPGSLSLFFFYLISGTRFGLYDVQCEKPFHSPVPLGDQCCGTTMSTLLTAQVTEYTLLIHEN